MSHLDDLDEFEAELELSLKREYSAVFSLFRYCVLTQDATYLCNKLDLEALPQVSYPFFHVAWRTCGCGTRTGRAASSRRPRSTPRATSRSRSYAPKARSRRLTAEALAERIGQPLSGDDDSL